MMDVYIENNINTTVDNIEFESSLDLKTHNQISGNGGNSSGVFEWETTEGFTIKVKLGRSSGAGSIKVFKGSIQNLVSCVNFNSPTLPFIIDILPDECVGGYFVFIESSSC